MRVVRVLLPSLVLSRRSPASSPIILGVLRALAVAALCAVCGLTPAAVAQQQQPLSSIDAMPPAAQEDAVGQQKVDEPSSRKSTVEELDRANGAAIEVRPAKTPRRHVPAKYDVSKIGDRGIGSGLDFYSLEKEEALGRELAADVERDARLITDPVVTEYVNRVAQNLVRNSDAKVPFTVKVIDSEEVNAFALPGGFFYVNSGLILAADNEAELAGVMAHEIAHVAARHATKNDTKAQILNLASVPLIFLGGPIGYAVREAVGFAVPLGYMKFSRDMEREADLLGLEYAYATGYDPQEFVRFFETLKAREKAKQSLLAKAFASHPMTGDRIKRAQQEIEKYLPPKREYIVDSSDFEAVKAHLAALENSERIDSIHSLPRPTLRRRDRRDEDGPPRLERH